MAETLPCPGPGCGCIRTEILYNDRAPERTTPRAEKKIVQSSVLEKIKDVENMPACQEQQIQQDLKIEFLITPEVYNTEKKYSDVRVRATDTELCSCV